MSADINKVSYILGHQIGGDFKAQGIDVNSDEFIKGLTEALSGTAIGLSEDELKSTMMAFQQEMTVKMQEAAAKAGAENLEKGRAFLEENKSKPGIQVTESGLQYQELVEGHGATPSAEQQVEVHYHGTLIDGTVFDSSMQRGQTITFPVNGVIQGWQEALQLMKEGAKWRVFIPAELAYGERGAGEMIGPNSTLVFDVQLIKVL